MFCLVCPLNAMLFLNRVMALAYRELQIGNASVVTEYMTTIASENSRLAKHIVSCKLFSYLSAILQYKFNYMEFFKNIQTNNSILRDFCPENDPLLYLFTVNSFDFLALLYDYNSWRTLFTFNREGIHEIDTRNRNKLHIFPTRTQTWLKNYSVKILMKSSKC